MSQIKKVLIANRGEIALRVIRACRDMGIRTVAVYSTADRDAMHVQLADESVCIGPAVARESYLNESAILTAALLTNADAIHPGYGFLSERADFARKVEQHDMIWIGPAPDMIEKMGDKVNAKRTAIECGLPVVPGSEGAIETLESALEWAEKIGYPVMLKAAAGGGGRGMRPVASAEEMAEAFQITKTEAKSSFGDDTLYMEKLLIFVIMTFQSSASQAQASVKPSSAPIIPYTQAIRFTERLEYKALKRSMPLKTVFCFRSSENAHWHLKARETREKRKPRRSLQSKRSYAQICSAPYLTIFAHRSRRFPVTQTICLQTMRCLT